VAEGSALDVAKPRARPDLVVRTVGDEIVVYDRDTHVAHCLNRQAAAVFRAADGKTRIDEIAARLAPQAGLALEASAIRRTVDELEAAGLLESTATSPLDPSRRGALLKLGLGAMALAPIGISLVVPTPAEAAATCVPAAACTTANPGQPCFVLAQSECLTKICTGVAGDCQ
jgi:hypothetical protein